MSVQPRQAKLFAGLLVSMTAGTMVLMALSNNPPPAGAFCLSSYYHLDPIEEVIVPRSVRSANLWNRIEICLSNTKAGNIERLARFSGQANPEEINYHFVICNGLGGADGQIQPTEKWQRQQLITPDRSGDGGSHTIRICVIADGVTTLPTDFQAKRADKLVEGLCRKFNIQPGAVCYPSGW
jgi:hypothetical protein